MSHAPLPPLHIPAALENLHYPQHNLLPVGALTSDLALDIRTAWPDPAQHDQVDHLTLIYTSPTGNVHEFPQHMPGPIHFPHRLYLPSQYLQEEGVSKVAFKVRNHAGATFESETERFTIDLRVPNGGLAGSKPEVDEELSQGDGVTHQYLQEHDHRVDFFIALYDGQTDGDRIGLSIGGPNEPVLSYKTVTDTTNGTVMSLEAKYFFDMADGVHLAYYKLFSRAGKVGPNSKGTFIRIKLGSRS
ncbi:hypothetical protein [Pseudomonas asplenii]|uniref:hypothetical protein n=1 Tax=Pseudomonas asplenii TaxID=53407 RepID=UPI0006B57DA5|nr:hypothetical protein [Pseudomonas fuscovaginae]KPA96108.1 hypothetical protein PF70_03874 [Pseudomonas fuscovaginae]